MAITGIKSGEINNGRDLAVESTRSEKAQANPELVKDDATKKALHAKPETLPIKYTFKKVQANDPELAATDAKLLNRFQINESATKYDTAVMSEDGNTLVVANRGEVGLKQLYGGTNSFTRTMYKIFGWIPRIFGAPHKAVAANRYKELFNKPDIDEQGEPLKHVLSALKSGEYHTVTVFHKDSETGEFNQEPVAVAIIDAFDNVIETNVRRQMEAQKASEEEIVSEIKSKRETYGKYFSGDKLIPISQKQDDFKDLLHQVVEGLYAAQGFDGLLVPSEIHPQTNMNSNDLNYAELDWHYIRQKPDGKWNIVGDSKLLDSLELDPKDKEAYKAQMTETQYSPKLTVVRPLAKANEPIPPFLGYLQQWSTMSQGSDLRTEDPDDLKLPEMTEPVNAKFIENYNKSL